MRIGIFLGQHKQTVGGGFTYEESILNALRVIKSPHEFFCFHYGERASVSDGPLRWVQLTKATGQDLALNKAVLRHHIELLWFTTIPFYEPVEVPYFITVWDLQHRLQPYFPEVSLTGWTWDKREQFYQYVLPRAAFVIAGTQAGKNEVIDFYRIPPARVKILPLPTPDFALQAGTLGALSSTSKSPYLFYPAQFWPHKNHIAVLLALKILVEREQLDFSIVFTGSDVGNLRHVQETAANLGLNDRVQFRGFVPREELIQLYQNAFALVFPSFFGPDNIPPLEAFALGCPVITARVSGADEQLGDAVLLFDPKDEVQLVAAIKELRTTPNLREKLVERGRLRARQWTTNDYAHKIFDMVDEFRAIRRCWSSHEPFRHL